MSFIQRAKEMAPVISVMLIISSMFSSIVFFYLDARNDQRYLQLLEITKTLDPLYISIASMEAQQRIETIIDLKAKIFKLRFNKNTIEDAFNVTGKEPRTLTPFDASALSQYKADLIVAENNKR